ncbi:unnamed protein product [Linum tenue]|uniref:Uncharacterized protein n=1 Tax=Linum tenue TaxID=586396 RepID=A0AAV0MEM0_9ROSI|nr:unnamed protein product [Linum tenue]
MGQWTSSSILIGGSFHQEQLKRVFKVWLLIFLLCDRLQCSLSSVGRDWFFLWWFGRW